MALALFLPILSASANQPDSSANSAESNRGATVAASDAAPKSVRADGDAPPIVIGFLGGFVRHDDAVHTTVQVARSLRQTYPNAIHVETFENRRMSDAHALILRLLGAKTAAGLTEDAKRSAHIILYGHSWGACAVVSLARELKSEGIPVVLTVQVDSVSKSGRDDATIPDNVRYAANFYQDKGFIRGQQRIVAADASRTTILGNFHLDYTANPISCPEYPWYTRFFMRSHIEIECDQKVWQRVENLIREQLPTTVGSSHESMPGNDTAMNAQPAETSSTREQ